MSMLKRAADKAPPNDVSPKKQKVAHDHTVLDTVTSDAASTISVAETQTNVVMDIDLLAFSDDDEPLSDVSSDDDKDQEQDSNATKVKNDDAATIEAPKRKTLLPPIQDAFIPWKAEIVTPDANRFWGIKPVTGDPRPHVDQPAARTSDAATNPAMWEDRTFRAKRGSRYVKYFGTCKPENTDNLPDLDQESLLVVKLIDMRPKSRRDPTPRRIPTFYQYPGGKPKDWNDNQAIKCINDRRSQAIERMTLDPPWTRLERAYLAQILTEHPDASIWEITELHNDRFMGKDFRDDTTFKFTPFSDGRTVESVRHEYMLFKPLYNKGEYPENVRTRADNSVAGKALRAAKLMEQSFGLPDKSLEKQWDNEHAGDDDEDVNDAPKKRGAKTPKTRNKVAHGAIKKAAPKKKKMSKKDLEARLNMAKQDKLEDSDEELLELAGAYNNLDEEQTSGLSSVRGSFSTLGGKDTTKQSTDDLEADRVIEQIVGQIVDQAVAFADEQQPVDQKDAQPQKSLKATIEAPQVETEADTVERRPSLHAARKLEIDENYDDEDEAADEEL